MTDFTIRTDCRLCAGPIEKVLDLGSTSLANELKSTREESLAQDKFPLFLAQCKTCGHVQLPVVVKPERLFPPDYPYKSGTNPVFRAHLKEFAATVSGMIPPGSIVLEIASNDGTLISELSASGLSAVGIDPAASLDKNEAYRDFFTSKWAEWQVTIGHSFDCIVALNVFAHVDDLNDFTAGVAALLPDDGLFVFEVGYVVDVIAKGLFDVAYHEHTSYHHLRPLVPFFRTHGLHLFDAHRVDSQGGSVRCYVAKRGDSRGESDRLRALLAAEEGLSVEPLRVAIRRLRDAMLPFIEGADDAGETVAGFGAPAKLTTLLEALSFPPMEPEDEGQFCIYDDNPAKVGKFTPGTGIPIRPTSELLADNPDYLILFSWNFADEVIPRLRALGYRGKIVVPFPEFRVVE